MPRVLNRLTHRFSAKITWWISRTGFECVRRRAGLPKRKSFWPFDDDPLRPRTPILCAWSPSVFPASNDWPRDVHITGSYFFRHDNSYSPQEELLSFLQEGNTPICISFGSMVHRDKERIDHIVGESLKRTGNRRIILSGWSGVQKSPSKDLLYLEAVPHGWLLPRCKTVIHHGEAGTTAAGLRVGISNIVIPFLGDQLFSEKESTQPAWDQNRFF